MTEAARKMFNISRRAWHRIEVAAKKKKVAPPIRRKVGRRTPTRIQPFFAMGQEREVEGLLLTRMKRKPVHYMAENDHGVKVIIAKMPKGHNGWDVLLPEGGMHSFRGLRHACRFAGDLVPIPDCDEHCETNNKFCVTHGRRLSDRKVTDETND